MKRQRLFLLIILCLLIQQSQAQDTLYIFTKHDCSVCKQTKQVLLAKGITYLEKDVAIPANASQMLSRLAFSGFTSSIYMPVIYVGKKLLHPAYSTDSGLVNVEINEVVDSIFRRHRRGEITNLIMSVDTDAIVKQVFDGTADCEHTTGAVYVVVANYSLEKEAIGAVQILLKNGYPNAGFVYESNIFRVYLALYPDFGTASTQLTIDKFKFTDAYLFIAK